MLQELYINNYIIFNKEKVRFTEGFNVITGETGSGKSVIIDAIGVLCGGKLSKDDIKTGAQKAVIQGLFIIDNDTSEIDEKLIDIGINPEEDKSILIQREVNLSGKSFCRINGQTVTLTMLRTVAPLLMDIVAQNEHQILFKPSMHIKLLDSFGSDEFNSKLKELYQLVNNIKDMEGNLHIRNIRRYDCYQTGIIRKLSKMEDIFEKEKVLIRTVIGNSNITLISAEDNFRISYDLLKNNYEYILE